MTLLKDDERRWLEIATTRNMFATEISDINGAPGSREGKAKPS